MSEIATRSPGFLSDRGAFDRFCESVDVADDGCWLWTGRTFPDSGRGVFPIQRTNGKWQRAQAHRAAYELLVGPILDRLVLDHLCNNKICVAPEHLDPVTQAVNRERQTTRQTRCYRGHPLSGDNLYTYVRPSGTVTRHCRECRRLADRRCDARKRERS